MRNATAVASAVAPQFPGWNYTYANQKHQNAPYDVAYFLVSDTDDLGMIASSRPKLRRGGFAVFFCSPALVEDLSRAVEKTGLCVTTAKTDDFFPGYEGHRWERTTLSLVLTC